MADDLKRVGLVFKADGTVDFAKSLNEVNASVRENRTAFELAKSQWDKNTKSLEKLQTTQKYMKEQTKDYTDKVELLERQLSELENAEIRDEKAIQRKKSELNQAKTSLNNYKKGLEEVEDKLKSGTVQIEEYAKQIEEIGKKSTDAGKTLSKGLTAPIVAVGGLAIKAAMELDAGYDTIITKTGATGEALQELNDVADRVFGNLPVEMETVGIAVGEVNTRFGSLGDELENLSREFIEFSEINGTDLNGSIDTVDKIMKQFNIDISHTGELLGILTKRSQETGISTDILMQKVNENSATFKELGFSVTDSINLLSQMEINGVDSATALAGMRKAITNLAADGIPANEALGQIIESIKNATSDTKALNLASEVFGTKGAVQMTEAIRSGRFSIDELSDSLGKYGETVRETYETTLDPWDKMKVATNDLKLAGADLASEMFEVLAPMIDGLCESIEGATEWFGNLDEGQKQTIVTIGLVLAAIGPLLVIFGSVCGGVSKIIGLVVNVIGVAQKVAPIMGTIGTGAKALWGILSANPIGLIITAIGLLVTAFVTAYNKCEWFRNGVNNIIGGVVNFFKGAINKIKGFFDFEWKLPKIKLPHFKVSGKFSLDPPSIPKFSISWYAKGGILNRPTIFGANGSSLMGGGEAGPEAVLPISLLRKYIREENNANNYELARLIQEAIRELGLYIENNVYVGNEKIETILTKAVIKELSRKTRNLMSAKGY